MLYKHFVLSLRMKITMCRNINHLFCKMLHSYIVDNSLIIKIFGHQTIRMTLKSFKLYEVQDLPLFLKRFWALKRECSELHNQ